MCIFKSILAFGFLTVSGAAFADVNPAPNCSIDFAGAGQCTTTIVKGGQNTDVTVAKSACENAATTQWDEFVKGCMALAYNTITTDPTPRPTECDCSLSNSTWNCAIAYTGKCTN